MKTTAPQRRAHAAVPLTPRDVLFVLFRHGRLAASLFALCVALALVAAVLLPDQYRSEAKLQVNLGLQNTSLDPYSRFGQSAAPVMHRDAEMNTEADVLRSRAVAERVVDALGPAVVLGAPSDDRSAALTHLARAVKVDVEPASSVLKVAYEATDPARAQQVAQAYVDGFTHLRSDLARGTADRRVTGDMEKQAEIELAAAQAELQAAKHRTGVADAERERVALIDRISTLEKELDAARGELSGKRQTVAALAARLDELPRTVVLESKSGEAMGSLDELRGKLAALRLEEQDLASRYLDTSTPLRIVRDKIKSAEAMVVNAEADGGPQAQTSGTNVTYNTVQTQLELARGDAAGLEARLATLDAQLAETEALKRRNTEAEVALQPLVDRVAQARANVTKHAEAAEQVRVARTRAEGNVSNITVPQPATLPLDPSGPNRKLLVLFGLVLGGATALGGALAAETLGGKVARPDDLVRLGLPAAASVPFFTREQLDDQLPDGLTPGRASSALAVRVRPLSELLGGAYRAVADAVARVVGPTGERPARRYVRAVDRDGVKVGVRRPDVALSPRQVLEMWRRTGPRPALTTGSSFYAQAALPAPELQTAGTGLGHGGPQLAPRHDRPARHHLAWRLTDAGHGVLERLLFAGVGSDKPLPRVIGVVGTTTGVGATTLAGHLAGALADWAEADAHHGDGEQGGRVLLVDANLHAPGAGRWFELDGGDGVTDWLAAGTNAGRLERLVRRTDRRRLDVLPAGPADRTLVARLPALIEALRHDTAHEAVVVDLPSLGNSASAPRLAALCDAVLVVTRYDLTHREQVREAVARLREVGAKPAGGVLNARRFPVPGRLYRMF